MGVNPKIGVGPTPQNGWFIKIDDLGVPLFLETPISKKVMNPLKTNVSRPQESMFRRGAPTPGGLETSHFIITLYSDLTRNLPRLMFFFGVKIFPKISSKQGDLWHNNSGFQTKTPKF